MKEKMWGILLFIGGNTGPRVFNELPFDPEVWELILKKAVESGVNTFLMDVGDGVEFSSHPEIAVKNAWSKSRFREEFKRVKDLGITMIPKFNFATPHSRWMGKYQRMISTPEYYRFCRDLIYEVYDLFEQPEYIHLGMDEEDAKHVGGMPLAVFRQGELYWHDLRFLMDCVHDTGAKPWIWSCPLFEDPEGYKAHIKPDEAILSPWHYNAVRKEHWTPIESRADYVAYYNEGEYKNMGIKYVEEDPFLVKFMELAIPLMKEGYKYVPSVSVYNRCPYNTHDIVEYFRDNAPDDQIVGYLTAPWYRTIKGSEQYLIESFDLLKAAKEEFYK